MLNLRSNHFKLWLLAAVVLLLILGYLFWDIGSAWQYAIKLRLRTIAAIIVSGLAVGTGTMIFHSIVNNRVVTPQALGLDKLFELSKTLVIYFFGASALLALHPITDYLMSVSIMLIFALLLYQLVFKRVAQTQMYFLLLIGLICATLFDSLTTFLQVLLNPDEFQIAAYAGFASFNTVKMPALYLSMISILPIVIYASLRTRQLDVMALGRDHALNLGIHYDAMSLKLLVLVVLALASATALAGPMMFLGLLVLNISLQLFKTHQHRILLPGIILISIAVLMIGQFIVLHLLNLKTTLSVIINFVGGIYFFWILLKENKKWQFS
ncbi:iron chelate uptake ABC transporter family permease subunit [Acinetobacter larvae]|uniref:Iron ABC transporter permease n=1 Tax=Acinetobacter larvae TaxID=1789224 RepID=A0A1B2LYM2_9GAMM|nr:iron chelate uptake ABC transporter family permease subunit [Acinetobacter larvae]AOA58044.1 iron ABC transporter permease [Acinetobacter larvae]